MLYSLHMSFRRLPGWKSAAAAGAMTLGAQVLDGCTFGPPAWRTPQMGPQGSEAIHQKLTEPRHVQAAHELARLPQIELHQLQDELRRLDPALVNRLQSIEAGAVAGNAFLYATNATPLQDLERALNTMRTANMARTHVETGSLQIFFRTMRHHAQTNLSSETADRLVRFMGGGLIQLPDTLNTEPDRIDHLRRHFRAEELSLLAHYLSQTLAPRIQDPAVRLTVEQAANALQVTGDLPRPLLVALLREALQDGPLFDSIRRSIQQQRQDDQASIARVIPSLRAGIFDAAVTAQLPEGAETPSVAQVPNPYDTPGTPSTRSGTRHRHRRRN